MDDNKTPNILEHNVASIIARLRADLRKLKVDPDEGKLPYFVWNHGDLYHDGRQSIGVSLHADGNCSVVVELVIDGANTVSVKVAPCIRPVRPDEMWSRRFPVWRFKHGAESIATEVRRLFTAMQVDHEVYGVTPSEEV